MKIAIITYVTPHQKTQDVISALLLKGYNDLHLFALPFTARPARKVKYIHRFNNPIEISPKDLAVNIGANYTESTADELSHHFRKHDFDFILIAGAGLLPKHLALNFKIINAHPGFLPKVKGLDSLKWALFNGVPEIGVTTHFISDKADEGTLIDQVIVPLYQEDSFHSFALRQYEMEIELIANSIETISNSQLNVSLNSDIHVATRRMPVALEEEMIQKFESRRLKAPSIWTS